MKIIQFISAEILPNWIVNMEIRKKAESGGNGISEKKGECHGLVILVIVSLRYLTAYVRVLVIIVWVY